MHSVKKLARIIPVQRLHNIITYIVYRLSFKCFEFGYHEWDRVLFFIITTPSAIFKHLYIREKLVHISWIKLRIWFAKWKSNKCQPDSFIVRTWCRFCIKCSHPAKSKFRIWHWNYDRLSRMRFGVTWMQGLFSSKSKKNSWSI